MACLRSAIVLLALVSGLTAVAANAQQRGGQSTDSVGNWAVGRSTFYGTDAWSIHKGSCQFGWLDKTVGTGWDVAAISDRAPDFGGSCGKCKEVRCKPMNFNDGYGQWLQRSDVCYNDYASVVVMVTDTCPCIYPNNYASNKRWCCNDMYHMDLSVWAWEKLSSKRWGVIGVEWRDVPCWYKPKNPARVPSWEKRSPDNAWERPPWGWNRFMDKRLAVSGVDKNSYNSDDSGK